MGDEKDRILYESLCFRVVFGKTVIPHPSLKDAAQIIKDAIEKKDFDTIHQFFPLIRLSTPLTIMCFEYALIPMFRKRGFGQVLKDFSLQQPIRIWVDDFEKLDVFKLTKPEIEPVDFSPLLQTIKMERDDCKEFSNWYEKILNEEINKMQIVDSFMS